MHTFVDHHPLAKVLPVGPRSVLFGAHQFLIHPRYVNKAWKMLYKTKATRKQKIAFFLHDLGYLFQWCRMMDDAAGQRHPEWGARAMSWLFDYRVLLRAAETQESTVVRSQYWYRFCAGHSRHYAEKLGIDYSPLMRADKLATHLYPRWLYAFLMTLSGEYVEYKEYWIDKGGYPGKADDSAWEYAGHLQAEWKRFTTLGGEVHGSNGGI